MGGEVGAMELAVEKMVLAVDAAKELAVAVKKLAVTAAKELSVAAKELAVGGMGREGEERVPAAQEGEKEVAETLLA